MLTDDEFVRQFEDGTLAEFPHASHVRLTILYLRRYGREETHARVADGIRRFATLKGAPEKFHVTMTRAWVELIESARRAHPEIDDPGRLVAACPILLDSRALLRFYSREQLESPAAKATWMPPDHPLDAEAI
jgi:hypothetical protein